ncbi:MAG: hypothetical protein ABSG01_06795 [Anaerolineales bacterium]|jgi:hypothetical protein
MSSINLNNSSEEDQSKPKTDEDKQPGFEPKRVIHLSKPLTNSEEKPRWLGSIFRRKPIKTPMDLNQSEDIPDTEANPYSETGEPKSKPTRGDRTVPDFSDKKINPGLRLRALLSGDKNPPPQIPPSESQPPSKQTGPNLVYLYVAVGLSLLVNAILVVALVITSGRINTLKTDMNGLLSGLYGNFSGMDNASITTTITINTEVPINFMLPIQQNTDVILTESLTIPHAQFALNSGGLSINAPASITLPAGTNLPVALNVAVPVQVSIPLTLQVPVNIPLSQTGLHQPLTGLQDTVRSYYCKVDKNAQYPQGIYLCKDHENPTPTPTAP